ncbi:MAG TPA: PAS domain-containing protein, partial [Isosphaeraceae bacterium]
MAEEGEVLRLRAQIATLEQMLAGLAQTEAAQAERLVGVLRGLREHERQQARAAEAMRQQAAVLQSILDGLGSGVIVADLQGRFLHFNAAAERIMGVGRTDVPLDRWTERYGSFLPDRVTPYPPRDLPLARAIRGEAVDDAEV